MVARIVCKLNQERNMNVQFSTHSLIFRTSYIPSVRQFHFATCLTIHKIQWLCIIRIYATPRDHFSNYYRLNDLVYCIMVCFPLKLCKL